jgi:hypothetical protein
VLEAVEQRHDDGVAEHGGRDPRQGLLEPGGLRRDQADVDRLLEQFGAARPRGDLPVPVARQPQPVPLDVRGGAGPGQAGDRVPLPGEQGADQAADSAGSQDGHAQGATHGLIIASVRATRADMPPGPTRRR